jgi:hypothetical protein
MCPDHVVTSCTTLIDLPSLSDDIVIPDIPPSTSNRMILVDRSQEHHIIEIFLHILGSMMDDDRLDSFYRLDRPCELPSILSTHFRDSLHEIRSHTTRLVEHHICPLPSIFLFFSLIDDFRL